MIKWSYIPVPNNIYTASFNSGAPNVSWHQDKVGMWCNSQSNCEEACNLFCAPVTLRLNEFSCRTGFNDSSLDIWNTSTYLLLSKGKSLQHWGKKERTWELLSLKNLISISSFQPKLNCPLPFLSISSAHIWYSFTQISYTLELKSCKTDFNHEYASTPDEMPLYQIVLIIAEHTSIGFTINFTLQSWSERMWPAVHILCASRVPQLQL